MENMREYWAREAEMMRDKSAVLGDIKPTIPKVSASVKFPFYFDRYKLKGMNTSMSNIADDMCFGDGVNRTTHFRYTTQNISDLGVIMRTTTMAATNDTLWADMLTMVTSLFSIDELEGVAIRMVNRFRRNEGGEFSDAELTKAVLKHASTIEFCKKIEIGIQEKLRVSRGDISKLENRNDPDRESVRYGRPTFSTLADTFAGGLTICINDTWAYEVSITNFSWDSESDYSVSYKVILYDHFGLDLPDLQVNTYYILAGFRAWFVLQHQRNFRPFITRVEFDKTFKSNVKIGKDILLERAKQELLQKAKLSRKEPGGL